MGCCDADGDAKVLCFHYQRLRAVLVLTICPGGGYFVNGGCLSSRCCGALYGRGYSPAAAAVSGLVADEAEGGRVVSFIIHRLITVDMWVNRLDQVIVTKGYRATC